MKFIDAAQATSFAALFTYAVIVALAHIFSWQRFSQLRSLGVVVGCVLGFGISAQFQLAGLSKYFLIGFAVASFGYLFGLLETRFPLHVT